MVALSSQGGDHGPRQAQAYSRGYSVAHLFVHWVCCSFTAAFVGEGSRDGGPKQPGSRDLVWCRVP